MAAGEHEPGRLGCGPLATGVFDSDATRWQNGGMRRVAMPASAGPGPWYGCLGTTGWTDTASCLAITYTPARDRLCPAVPSGPHGFGR
ncbi:MAG: hypothetical protein R6X14_01320 [bacterium]